TRRRAASFVVADEPSVGPPSLASQATGRRACCGVSRRLRGRARGFGRSGAAEHPHELVQAVDKCLGSATANSPRVMQELATSLPGSRFPYLKEGRSWP